MSNLLVINLDTKELKPLNQFINQFPQKQVASLSMIAKRGRGILRKDLLSGQALKLKSSERDVRGRYLISGKVGAKFSINFASYPLNLYERGRTLRSGRKEPGRHILLREFKNLLSARLQSLANEAYTRTIQKAVDKL